MISKAEERQIVAAFDDCGYDAPDLEFSDFVTAVLGLNPSQRAALLPDPTTPPGDPRRRVLDQLAALLIAHRTHLLADFAKLPTAVVFKHIDPATKYSSYHIMGLAIYLNHNGEKADFLARVRRSQEVRNYLAGIGDGFKLELLAASIMAELHDSCNPTRRGADQGVDCLAFDAIMEIDTWCCRGEVLAKLDRLGERLHIIASCKANEGNVANGIPNTISPAHVRELIGAWLIQRSAAGLWHTEAGVKLLSPIQLLLVTTYRLSDDSLSQCRKLGVAVWGLPELIYLICRFAPDAVFAPVAGQAFQAAEADKWVGAMDAMRLVGPAVPPCPFGKIV
jgi:hypothetical protein